MLRDSVRKAHTCFDTRKWCATRLVFFSSSGHDESSLGIQEIVKIPAEEN